MKSELHYSIEHCVGSNMAATWLPSLVLTQSFKAAWSPASTTKQCSWNEPMKGSVKSGKERTNGLFFWINRAGKVIKSQLWDLFIIHYCSIMQSHCEKTYMCCSHVLLWKDFLQHTQAPLFFTRLVHYWWLNTPLLLSLKLTVRKFSVKCAVKCSSVNNAQDVSILL